MKLVAFNELSHYPHMLLWWSERGFPSTPLWLLPPAGLVLELQGQPVCAGFLYGSDGGCSQITHLVSDKTVDYALRSEALDTLIMALHNLAHARGFRMVSGATNLPGLIQRYERLGFQTFDKNITILGKEF